MDNFPQNAGMSVAISLVQSAPPGLAADKAYDRLVDLCLIARDDPVWRRIEHVGAFLRRVFVRDMWRNVSRFRNRIAPLDNRMREPVRMAPSDEGPLLPDSVVERIGDIIERLPDSYSTTLCAFAVCGSIRSAADVLAISPSTFQYRLGKVVSAIQRELAREDITLSRPANASSLWSCPAGAPGFVRRPDSPA